MKLSVLISENCQCFPNCFEIDLRISLLFLLFDRDYLIKSSGN